MAHLCHYLCYGPLVAQTVHGLGPVPDPSWRECVAQHRLRLDLTKQQLAELCGISRTTLYRIESGRHDPTPEQVALIERTLLTYVKPELIEAVA